MSKLDLTQSSPDLCAAFVDIQSVSGTEEKLANTIEAALSSSAHLKVFRHGNTVVARTDLGRDERITGPALITRRHRLRPVVAGPLPAVLAVAGSPPSALKGDIARLRTESR